MFGNMKQMGQLASLYKRKDEIAEAMRALSERVAALRVEGQAGGGVCRAWVTGKLRLDRIEFEPSVLAAAGVSPDGRAQLERLTAEAVNDASEKCQRLVAEMVSEEAQRLGIEDLMPKGGGGPMGALGELLG